MLKSFCIYALCVALGLSGCTTTYQHPVCSGKIKSSEATIPYPSHRKSPYGGIAFYQQKAAIKRPYRIIGKETISRYNFVGLERQSATVNDLLRKVAISMGGDAIIDIRQDPLTVEGTVISYERALL
jgi:hypothetical protein